MNELHIYSYYNYNNEIFIPLAAELAFSSIILLSAKSFIKFSTSRDQFIIYIGMAVSDNKIVCSISNIFYNDLHIIYYYNEYSKY